MQHVTLCFKGLRDLWRNVPKAIFLAILVAALAASGVSQTRKVPPARPAEPVASDPLIEIEKLLEKQQFTEAESKLLEVVKTQPGNPQAWFDLGFAQSGLNKNAEAAVAYRKAVELSPKWFEASLNLGVALAASGNFKEAAPVLKNAVQLKPATGAAQGLSKAWFSLAEVLEDSEPKEALNAYQKASGLAPGDSVITLATANLLAKTGDTTAAERLYLKLAEAGNDQTTQTAQATEDLISLYLKQRRLTDAETWLKKYLAENPQSIPAQAQLGRVLAAQGKLKEGLALLEALPNATADPASARQLADLYMQDKQYAPASKLYHDLLLRAPRDAELHWNLGSALLHQHKYPEAQEELLQALQLKPTLADAYFELAYAAQQNKQYELAIRVLEARAKLLPENAATYWIRAVSFDSLHAYKQAAENYRKFLATEGGKSPDQEFEARHRLLAIEPRH
ncbi:MAG TPA: tetratricopeptide repeat protein [Candidatus Saccharimonadales bacterium]|nr:tetratricopeptide repeat protein [Candidatus Saccharimonadales bacterium]